MIKEKGDNSYVILPVIALNVLLLVSFPLFGQMDSTTYAFHEVSSMIRELLPYIVVLQLTNNIACRDLIVGYMVFLLFSIIDYLFLYKILDINSGYIACLLYAIYIEIKHMTKK